MCSKIFVSYKYKDEDVEHLKTMAFDEETTVRKYVDKLKDYLGPNIYKGEHDGEDLSGLSDEAIWEKLKPKIYDSTVTIIMISPNMRERNKRDRDQWIPWEISYSLKEMTRHDRTSHSNALLAIVLPDKQGSYSYYYEQRLCGYTAQKTGRLFLIMRENMFNEKNPYKRFCPTCRQWHYYLDHSYIMPVRWSTFICNPQRYIDAALERQKDIDSYNITKEI